MSIISYVISIIPSILLFFPIVSRDFLSIEGIFGIIFVLVFLWMKMNPEKWNMKIDNLTKSKIDICFVIFPTIILLGIVFLIFNGSLDKVPDFIFYAKFNIFYMPLWIYLLCQAFTEELLRVAIYTYFYRFGQSKALWITILFSLIIGINSFPKSSWLTIINVLNYGRNRNFLILVLLNFLFQVTVLFTVKGLLKI